VERIDKVQTDIIKCAMRCDHEKPATLALLAEWGVKPMHLWLHERALEYFYRVLSMSDGRMPKCILTAQWIDAAGNECLLKWQEYVSHLMNLYAIDHAVACSASVQCKSHVKKQIAAKHTDDVLLGMAALSTLQNYVSFVHPEHVGRMSFANVRPLLSGCYPSYGVELLMRVRLQCLSVHERTSRFRRCCNEDSALTVSASCCPACKDGSESLAHLLFVCPMYDEYRKEMFDGIKTVDGCAAKLSSMLNNADSLQKALSFVACGTWGDTSIEIASYIAAYLQKAWRLRNRCKHVGVPVHVVSPMHVGSVLNS